MASMMALSTSILTTVSVPDFGVREKRDEGPVAGLILSVGLSALKES